MGKITVKITQASIILLALISAFLTLPLVGLILPHDGLAERHNRPLSDFPASETFLAEPSQAFREFEAWIDDRIAFGLTSGRALRQVQYIVFGDAGSDGAVRNGAYVYLSDRNPPRNFDAIAASCPARSTWEARYQNALHSWTNISETLAINNIRAYFLIAPTKNLIYPQRHPETIPASLRARCLEYASDPAAPLARLERERGPEVIYPLQLLSDRPEDIAYHPAGNFHFSGLAASDAVHGLLSAAGRDQKYDRQVSAVNSRGDLAFLYGFDRHVASYNVDYTGSVARYSPSHTDLLSELVPAGAQVSAMINQEADIGVALILSDSYGPQVINHIAQGYQITYLLNTNRVSSTVLQEFISRFTEVFELDDIIIVLHDANAHGGRLHLISRALSDSALGEGIDYFGEFARDNLGSGFIPADRRLEPILGDGWHPVLNDIWSRGGEIARLEISPESLNGIQRIAIGLRLFRAPQADLSGVSVVVCGDPRSEAVRDLLENQIAVLELQPSSGCGVNSPITIELYAPEQPSPFELGRSGDRREIGIGVRRISFQ